MYRGWRYRAIECAVPNRRCVQLRLACLDVAVGCIADSASSGLPSVDPAALVGDPVCGVDQVCCY
jgi:hypothetical protein